MDNPGHRRSDIIQLSVTYFQGRGRVKRVLAGWFEGNQSAKFFHLSKELGFWSRPGSFHAANKLAGLSVRQEARRSSKCSMIAHRPGFIAPTIAARMFATPDSVESSLRKYHELGGNRFLFSGFEPLEDIRQIGENLIPRLTAFAQAATQSQKRKRPPHRLMGRPFRMVGVGRVELPTPAMSTQCSTTELYAHTIRLAVSVGRRAV